LGLTEAMKILSKTNIIVVIFIIGGWLSSFFLLSGNFDIPFISIPDNINQRGAFGDMFGLVNSLLTALTFLFIILNFYEQRKQIKLMHEEIQITKKDVKLTEETLLLTKKELVIQQKLTETQSDYLEKQSFENSFFNFLSLHNSILDGMKINDIHGLVEGRQCFDYVFSYLKKVYEVQNKNNQKHSSLNEKHQSDIQSSYATVFEKNENILDVYYRRMYNLVDFVYVHGKDNVIDAKRYSRIIRAQLSTNELALLFYDCLTPPKKQFIKFVKEYDLLKGLTDKSLIIPDHWELGVNAGLLNKLTD